MHRWLVLMPVLLAHPTLASAQFTYERALDPMTDADRSHVSAGSTASTVGSGALLSWRCGGSDRADIFISTLEFLDDGLVSVTLRFDQSPALTAQPWSSSASGTAVQAPSVQIVPLTDMTKAGRVLRAQLVDFRGVSRIYEFNLSDFTAALSRLSCYDAFAKRYAEGVAARDERQRQAVERARVADSTKVARDLARPDSIRALGPIVGDAYMKHYFPNDPNARNCPQRALIYGNRDVRYFASEEAAKAAGYVRATCGWPR